MKNLIINKNPAVETKFQSYPKNIKPKLNLLRQLIFETASEIESIEKIEETLKWGEPSYLVKKGSTIRIDWKEKSPQQYAIYFKCTSQVVPTIRKIYGDFFNYEKNRAIIFKLNDKVPKKELKDCISLALKYHTLKHEPFLGR